MRALVVEDQVEIAEDIGRALKASGFTVDMVHDGEEAWFKGSTENYTVVVLDIGLPKLDGVSVLRNWRREKVTTPVVMLTARGAWTERVDGIEAGADDYIAKPFHIEELLARVRAVVRRSSGHATSIFTVGTLTLDTRSNTVTRDGVRVDLGPLEYRMLTHLLLNRGKAVAQSELAEMLHGANDAAGSNAIEAMVRRLRKKIGDDVVMTQRGFGYIVPLQ